MGFKTTLMAVTIAASALTLAGEAYAKTLRYAEFGPNRGTRAEALNWFADEIKARSNGELEIEFHWGGSLAATKTAMQGISDGIADMGSIIGFFTPAQLRGYNIGDLPVENSDEWVGTRALYDFATTNPALQKEFADQGLTYVTNYTTGPVQLICSKDVKTLEDLKGTAVRGSGPYGKAMADLGAVVQGMGQDKVYEALNSGLIECNQNYYYSIKAYKQYEVAPYVLELDWGQNMAFGIVMNKSSYDSLSDAEKEIINAVGSEFIDYQAQLMIDGRVADKDLMTGGIDGKTITVTRLSDEERQTLLDSGAKYVDQWVQEATEQGYDGKALLDNYNDLIAKYTAEKDASGYPWAR